MEEFFTTAKECYLCKTKEDKAKVIDKYLDCNLFEKVCKKDYAGLTENDLKPIMNVADVFAKTIGASLSFISEEKSTSKTPKPEDIAYSKIISILEKHLGTVDDDMQLLTKQYISLFQPK